MFDTKHHSMAMKFNKPYSHVNLIDLIGKCGKLKAGQHMGLSGEHVWIFKG